MWKYIMLQVEFFQHPRSGRNMQLRLHSLCDYISVTFTVIRLTFMVMRDNGKCAGTDI